VFQEVTGASFFFRFFEIIGIFLTAGERTAILMDFVNVNTSAK